MNSFSECSRTISGNKNGTAYGKGLPWEVLGFQLLSIAIRAEYEIFALDEVDIGFISAGVSYTF